VNALGLYNYWIVIFLMMAGFYVVIARGNLVKKIVGLNLFQSSVCMFYISMGKVSGGTAPIFKVNRSGELLYDPHTVYTNPIPSVLILTAIVVGVSTTALGLAIVVRIKDAYGSIGEHEIFEEHQSQ